MLELTPLLQDFERIDHLDLHGNVRRNAKLSGTTHNVFGIQIGVGITLAVRKRESPQRLRYFRLPEMWRKTEKLEFAAKANTPWQTLAPDAMNSWLVPANADEYQKNVSLAEIFSLWSLGIGTNRDSVVYDWNRAQLGERVKKFVNE